MRKKIEEISEQRIEHLIERWWDEHGNAPVRSRDIFPLLPSDWGYAIWESNSVTEHAQRTVLGILLAELVGEEVGGWLIKDAGHSREANVRVYSLEKMGTEPAPASGLLSRLRELFTRGEANA